MTPSEIISDEEILRVHGHANFGSMSPREVVDDGVRKYSVGFHSGATQLAILLEHGLITKPRVMSSEANLTKKGKAYGRAIFRTTAPASQDDNKLRIAVEAYLKALDDLEIPIMSPALGLHRKTVARKALAALKSTAAKGGTK